MHEGAPPRPPARGARSSVAPPRPDLTAAAWNRRHAQHRRPHLAHWLRSLPDDARTNTLIYLFGALFFAIPGSVLVIAISVHAPAAPSIAVLVFVGVFFAAYASSALQHAGILAVRGRLLRAFDHGRACLMAAATCLPFATAYLLSWHVAAETLAWLLAGVLVYATGLLLRLLSHRPFLHRVWHGLLVLGSVFHFIAVASLTTAFQH